MNYAGVKNDEGIVAAIELDDIEGAIDIFKQSVLVNPQDDSTDVWRQGAILEITKKEFEEFLKSKELKDEEKAETEAAEIDDADIKPILLALVEGRADVAKRLLTKSKNKPKNEKPKEG